MFFGMCQGCFGSCKNKIDKLRKQGKDDELTRLQKRDKGNNQV